MIRSVVASPEEILEEAGFGFLDRDAPPGMLLTLLESIKTQARDLDDLPRGVLREALVSRLKKAGISSPSHLADAALASNPEIRKDTGDFQGRSLILSDPDPWPEPVDGAKLLAQLETNLSRYVVLPSGASVAIGLWIILTFLVEVISIAPRLTISSPTKRCGKTTLIDILLCLVRRPLGVANITPASVFRSIEKWSPTLLVDEADTFIRDKELTGILNSGHYRATAQIPRCVGDDHEPRLFSTFGLLGIALIGKLPGTLEDRSIVIKMRRKQKGDQVCRFRRDHVVGELEPLQRMAARWVQDNSATIADSEPEMPTELNDREQDCWRKLFAIADLVGGDWPERARSSALILSTNDEAENSEGVQLLADLEELFRSRGAERLTSAEIVEELGKMEERPWPEFDKDPITTRQLAMVLAPFEIRPDQFRLNGNKVRGYVRSDFEDSFGRYLISENGTSPTLGHTRNDPHSQGEPERI